MRTNPAKAAAIVVCLFALVAPTLQAQTAPPATASSSASDDDDLPDLSTLDDDRSSSSSSSSDSLGGDFDLDTHYDNVQVAAEALTCVGVYDLAIDKNMQEPGSDAEQRVTDMMDKRDSAASLYLGSAAKRQADADADADYKVSDADVAAKVARGDLVLADELSKCDDLVDLYGGWA